MYRSSEGLGFSLKPPSWLRKAATKAVDIVTQGKAAVDSVSANYETPAAAPAAPNAMPSWLIPAGIGLAALFVLPKFIKGGGGGRKRRRR